jgi:predicted nucleic acid-binding protein
VRLVVDASVALKWFLQGRPGELHVAEAEAVAEAIGRSGTELFAPFHWTAEIIAVLARIERGLVDDALLLLDDMRPVVVGDVPVLRRAAELATSLNHHLFDTLYHAVALEEGATLVTADESYFDKAKGRGAIQLLADFQVSEGT